MIRSSRQGQFSVVVLIATLTTGVLGLPRDAAAQWTEVVLYGFARSDGEEPRSSLVQANDGTLYGTTPYGGSSYCGIVFSLARDGSNFSVIHDFTYNACHPLAGLIFGLDGMLTERPN